MSRPRRRRPMRPARSAPSPSPSTMGRSRARRCTWPACSPFGLAHDSCSSPRWSRCPTASPPGPMAAGDRACHPSASWRPPASRPSPGCRLRSRPTSRVIIGPAGRGIVNAAPRRRRPRGERLARLRAAALGAAGQHVLLPRRPRALPGPGRPPRRPGRARRPAARRLRGPSMARVEGEIRATSCALPANLRLPTRTTASQAPTHLRRLTLELHDGPAPGRRHDAMARARSCSLAGSAASIRTMGCSRCLRRRRADSLPIGPCVALDIGGITASDEPPHEVEVHASRPRLVTQPSGMPTGPDDEHGVDTVRHHRAVKLSQRRVFGDRHYPRTHDVADLGLAPPTARVRPIRWMTTASCFVTVWPRPSSPSALFSRATAGFSGAGFRRSVRPLARDAKIRSPPLAEREHCG